MDFMNRGFRNGQPNSQNVDSSAHAPAGVPVTGKNKSNGKKAGGLKDLSQAGKLGFLLLIVALVALSYLALITFKGAASEASLIDKSKYQAIFLNGGQVYFGKITDSNNKFMDVNNVYYLRVNQQVQPEANTQNANNDISLVKLGCELHGPTDQMVINREQIIFWENLKDDGQVAEAIKQYKEKYPNGQDCSEQASSNNSVGSDSTTPTTTPPAATPSTNPQR